MILKENIRSDKITQKRAYDKLKELFRVSRRIQGVLNLLSTFGVESLLVLAPETNLLSELRNKHQMTAQRFHTPQLPAKHDTKHT